MTDVTNPNEFKNIRGSERTDIKGWAVDFDPKNDPTYPMKKRTNEEHKGYTWERPPQQNEDVEILKSVERPNLTAVFGTSTPPKGLSGIIRRFAFKYSESSYGRWLPLMLADRIGVVEGLIDDISHGYFPNRFKERGWNAEWKYNRNGFLIKAAVSTLVTAAIVAAIIPKKNKKKLKFF